MKLLRYGPVGHEKPGLVDADGKIRDLSGHVSDIAGEVLSPAGLKRLAALDPRSLKLVEGNPRLGPCVGIIPKFVAVGLNYFDHAAETGNPVPSEPILFMKATSSIVGPNDDVMIPRGSEKTDWEVELGIVIGSVARYVPIEHSLEHVAGYCVVNDVSERAYQMERGGQWTKGKSADTFGPVGPWLVTSDEVPDPQALELFLDVNGVRRQTGNTKTMIFGVAHLVSYISHFMTLMPGDVIPTGTPPGVGLGMKPPVFLKPGDEMRLGITGLGEQRQKVVAFQ
jgi:ureidoglycolate lyase